MSPLGATTRGTPPRWGAGIRSVRSCDQTWASALGPLLKAEIAARRGEGDVDAAVGREADAEASVGEIDLICLRAHGPLGLPLGVAMKEEERSDSAGDMGLAVEDEDAGEDEAESVAGAVGGEYGARRMTDLPVAGEGFGGLQVKAGVEGEEDGGVLVRGATHSGDLAAVATGDEDLISAGCQGGGDLGGESVAEVFHCVAREVALVESEERDGARGVALRLAGARAQGVRE
jgi:hypothetical protein